MAQGVENPPRMHEVLGSIPMFAYVQQTPSLSVIGVQPTPALSQALSGLLDQAVPLSLPSPDHISPSSAPHHVSQSTELHSPALHPVASLKALSSGMQMARLVSCSVPVITDLLVTFPL